MVNKIVYLRPELPEYRYILKAYKSSLYTGKYSKFLVKKKNSKMLHFLFVVLRWKETQNFLKELKALEMFCLI